MAFVEEFLQKAVFVRSAHVQHLLDGEYLNGLQSWLQLPAAQSSSHSFHLERLQGQMYGLHQLLIINQIQHLI